MYESYYNLAEMPFTISTDPRFMWWGEKHQEALANLRYGLLITNGYVVLTGDVGTGKTTLLNALSQSIEGQIHKAVINNPTLNPLEFFNLVANSYGYTSTIKDKTEFLLFLDSFLRKAHEKGKSVLLVIDEAHCLSETLLGEIRLLSNIEKNGTKLINVFFVGQNEFQKLIRTPSCRALRERITLCYELKPLTGEETAHYIKHRLRVAGAQEEVFTPAAIRRIHAFSNGYPRLINILCDRSMLTGYVNDQKILDDAVIDECGKEVSYLNPTFRQAEKNNLTGMVGDMRNGIPGSEGSQRLVADNNRPKSPVNTIERRDAAAEDTAELSEDEVKDELTGALGGGGAANKYWLNAMLVVVSALFVFASFQFVSRVKSESSVVEESVQDDKHVTPVENMTIEEVQDVAQISVKQNEGQRESIPDTKPLPQEIAKEEDTAQEAVEAEKPSGDETDAVAIVQPEEDPEIPVDSEKKQVPSSVDSTPIEKDVKEEKAVRISPLELASMAMQQQDYAKAVDILEAESEPLPDSTDRYNAVYVQALTALANEVLDAQPEKALPLLEKAAKLDPEDSNIHFSIGKAYTKLKRYSAAIEAYQRATLLDPAFVDALFNLGFLFATTGKYEEAESYFTQVVQLQPSYLDKALFNLAIIQEKMGKYESSLTNLQRAVAVEPKNQKAADYLRRILGEPKVAGDR